MKHSLIITLCLLLTLSGCNYSQFSAVATGSGMSGMLGSSIGGIIGGPRGSDVGSLIGMVAGGAAGAAITGQASSKYGNEEPVDVQGYYNDYQSHRSSRATASLSQWSYLEVTNVRLIDPNHNQRLDPNEHVCVTMDIYNRSDNMMYDIAPIITCDNRRVIISPTAIVSELASGEGFRYKVEIIAPSKLKSDLVTFTVQFGDKRQRVTLKTFSLRTNR